MANADVFFNNLNKFASEDINVSVFAKVTSYNANNNTVNVTTLTDKMPSLFNVPILNFGVGNFNINMPINTGNTVLILFLDYDFENLLIDGNSLVSAENTSHALDNAVALPFNFTALNAEYTSANNFELTNNANNSKIVLESSGDVTIETNGKIKLGSGTASSKIALANAIKTVFDSHTHEVGDVVTSVPSVNFPEGSSKVLAE